MVSISINLDQNGKPFEIDVESGLQPPATAPNPNDLCFDIPKPIASNCYRNISSTSSQSFTRRNPVTDTLCGEL